MSQLITTSQAGSAYAPHSRVQRSTNVTNYVAVKLFCTVTTLKSRHIYELPKLPSLRNSMAEIADFVNYVRFIHLYNKYSL